MLAIVGALLLGGAVFYIVYITQKAAETTAAEERLSLDFGPDAKSFKPPYYISLTKPLLQEPYVKIASDFWSPEKLEAWRKKLISAGIGRNIQPEHFVASKFWLALMVGALLFINYIFSSDPMPLWMPFMLTAAAFFGPNLHVGQLRDKRQFEVRLAMPYVLDLLTLSTEAGLDFMGAISKVVDRAPPGALIEELSTALKDIQLGKTRSEALRSMADRLDMQEMSSFVAVLVSADSMGASIGGVLRAQSDSLRAERLVRAEKLGAQASQKILVPLIFFILPAVMLMIFGPIILSMMGVKK
ncbi:MAG: type II secretion system F family protein [Bdellovibrionales bacterium]|nr:type II secretion system F family protein [Bdellovibrionales bacterium]